MAVNLPYTEDDIQKMLACQVHLGTKNVDFQMEKYTYKRRPDGVYVIDLSKTWEKMMLAARIIVAIENPADVCVIAASPFLAVTHPVPSLTTSRRSTWSPAFSCSP